MDARSARELLADAVTALESAGQTVWITDGTLLGAIREGDFLGHDKDVDLAMNAPVDEDVVAAALGGAGFVQTERFGGHPDGLELRFHRGGLDLDIFVFYADGDVVWHAAWLDGRMIRFPYAPFELERIDFVGLHVLAPAGAERYLETKYGDWRTPRTDWHWAYSPLNAEFGRRDPLFFLRRWVRLARERRR